jgi:uncharacterized protein YjbI with pentapeptide repeats
MSDFDNLAPSLINSLELPDWSNYGYHLLQRLGTDEEALKCTYLAREIKIERLVIIKEWWNLTEVECTECLPAIERLKQLDYPNIPRYLNSFTTPTGFAIVREYQEGTSLAQLGTLPPADIQLIANAVLKILGYLQYLQPIVIHGNIKPENIIVDIQAPLRVYLVDFRLFPIANSPLKDETPGFIPPEQLSNRPLSSASDLYSLGVCLICALTGTTTKTAPELLDRDYRPQFKHLLPDNIHPQLIAWLEKMVEPNYQRRHLNAGGAREPIGKIPSEKRKGIAIIPAAPAGEWIPWGIGGGIAIAMVLLLRHFIFIPDPAEKSPAQIARDRAIASQAQFEVSDRGKLINEKRCIACQLDNINFSKVDLSGALLDRSSLNGTNFSATNLTLAIFRDADLTRANFYKANLHKAAFYGAKLLGADLRGANLSGAKLVYAKLKGAWLRDTNLSNADLKFAELQQVDLTNANLTDADLSNADLSYTNLRNAKLVRAKLDGTILTGATMPDGSMHE